MAEVRCFLVLLFGTFFTKKLFDKVVPSPYMDEIFHVPQAQRYCSGNYTWDPKITTLPGLYITSKVLLKFFSSINFIENNCNLSTLRLFNTLGLGLSFVAFFVIITLKRPHLSNENRAFGALTMSLFPLHFFFGFLYYTDVFSTLMILWMTSLFTFRRIEFSAISGAAAVLIRQTNIVWVVMQVIISVWEVFEHDTLPQLYGINKNKPFVPKQEKKKVKSREKKNNIPEEKLVVTDTRALLTIWIKCCMKVFPVAYTYGIVIGCFVLFVIVNGGIAVGDKEAHQATINTPQVLYFGLFAGFFLSPIILPMWRRTVRTILNHWISFLYACFVGLMIVHFNTIVHPYLLADNRHYTFYIWKRLYEWYPLLRYSLVPVSITVWFAICTHLDLHPALSFSYIFCIFTVLIPQRLLEFRYFIVPYFLLRLDMNCFEWKHLVPELILYLLINAVTVHTFLFKPFSWYNSNEAQRFMW